MYTFLTFLSIKINRNLQQRSVTVSPSKKQPAQQMSKAKLEIVVKEWENKAKQLGEESAFARKHNFEIEARILYDQKRLIEEMCMSIRLKVIEELIQA